MEYQGLDGREKWREAEVTEAEANWEAGDWVVSAFQDASVDRRGSPGSQRLKDGGLGV